MDQHDDSPRRSLWLPRKPEESLPVRFILPDHRKRNDHRRLEFHGDASPAGEPQEELGPPQPSIPSCPLEFILQSSTGSPPALAAAAVSAPESRGYVPASSSRCRQSRSVPRRRLRASSAIPSAPDRASTRLHLPRCESPS